MGTGRRGRPRVLTPGEQDGYETSFLFGSQRSVTNMKYVTEGSRIAVDAIGEDGLEREFNIGRPGHLGFVKGNIRRKSILEQVGRLCLQDGYPDKECIRVLRKALHLCNDEGVSVKEVERRIREARMTAKASKGHR